jgi:hypothetical protein
MHLEVQIGGESLQIGGAETATSSTVICLLFKTVHVKHYFPYFQLNSCYSDQFSGHCPLPSFIWDNIMETEAYFHPSMHLLGPVDKTNQYFWTKSRDGD